MTYYRTSSPSTPEERLRKARTALLLDLPWFGSLSLRLRLEADERIPSMSVDGTTLTYNPDWVATQSDPLLRSYWATEVVRCALLHPYRMQGRDAKTWREASLNVACQIVKAAGMPLWPGAPDNPEYADLAVEDVYARLQRAKQDQDEQQSGDGSGAGQPGMGPAPKPDGQGAPKPGDQPGQGQPDGDGAGDDEGMTPGDWQIAGEQAAMVGRKAGNMPGQMDRALKASRESLTDWRTILRRFVEQTIPSDYSWSNPNRRYVAAGLYLPGITKENTPRLGVAVDTSGSIDQAMLAAFAREITAIMREVRPIAVDVVYCDTRVQGSESFEPDGEDVTLHAKGGGGTSFQPALDFFTDAEEPPAAVIYLTDLEASAPKEPEFPVLWAVPAGNRRQRGPFGETVILDPESR